MSPVRIFDVIIGGITTPMWLCGKHETARSGDGVRPPMRHLGEPKGFSGKCHDCMRGYVAPAAVDYVPTQPGCRVPTRAECPPMPEPMSWSARLLLLQGVDRAAKAKERAA